MYFIIDENLRFSIENTSPNRNVAAMIERFGTLLKPVYVLAQL